MKVIISEEQEKKLIKEYLTKDNGIPLWNYFKDYKSLSPYELVSTVEKASMYALYEIFTKTSNKPLAEYIHDTYGEETYDYLKKAIVLDDNKDVIDILKEFVLNDKKLTDFTANMILENKDWFHEYAFLFLSDPKISHNKWYVHITKSGQSIYENGFVTRINNANLHNMAFSKNRNNKTATSKDGYVYAYDADNVSSYVLTSPWDMIMFQGNGVEFSHSFDGDRQVMIPIPSIHNIVFCKNIPNMYYNEYVIVTNDGRELFKNKPIEMYDCIEWVKTNFEQYKNILVGRNG